MKQSTLSSDFVTIFLNLFCCLIAARFVTASISTHHHQKERLEVEVDLMGSATKATTSVFTTPSTDKDAQYNNACYSALMKVSSDYEGIFETNHGTASVSFAIHRNGEADACSTSAIPSSIVDMASVLSSLPNIDCDKISKYEINTFLTQYFVNKLSANNECASTTNPLMEGLPGHCDMGPDKTVIHNDHQQLIPIPSSGSLPCRWYTREGEFVTSLDQLASMAAKVREKRKQEQQCDGDDTCTGADDSNKPSLHLYGVPAGRVFMFAPKYVGETFKLEHVLDSNGEPLTVKVLSTDPRVFDIYNFFSVDESNDIINKAMNEQSKSHKFHRSTTGTGNASIFAKRTSENAWDTHGKTSLIVKKRCFELLGFEKWDEAYADGLQVLRYNQTTAYTPHMDYLDDRSGEEAYDYDTAGKGGNRFATVLMYFNDLPEGSGGETVFPRAWPSDLPVEERIQTNDMIQKLRESGEVSVLKENSWEEKMVAQCRTRLAIRPYKTRAVLFYSQLPNGVQDPKSYHGGCPMLNGTKYAANLWVWSGIRPEYPGAPLKRELRPDEKKTPHEQLHASFRNKNKLPQYNNAQVFYDEDGYFGELGPNDPPVNVNTFEGHVWNIKDKHTKKVLKTFIIDSRKEQEFVV